MHFVPESLTHKILNDSFLLSLQEGTCHNLEANIKRLTKQFRVSID